MIEFGDVVRRERVDVEVGAEGLMMISIAPNRTIASFRMISFEAWRDR